MAFVTGLILLDAPASALNNAGASTSARTDNAIEVKQIRTREGSYPYVSSQAFRYWLRETLREMSERDPNLSWTAAPIFRETKIAYTDSNPIKYADDDLFGYMRAQGKSEKSKSSREADESRAVQTETTDTVTRVSPFRVGTLVSLAPINLTSDFGVMSRHEGDPVPHEHQFYRATLKGLFSLDLTACGTFSYKKKTGFQNLDPVRVEEAKEKGLEHLASEQSYRLPHSERAKRIAILFEGLAQLEGGAKLTMHYTDVMPPLVIMSVTKGGNHIFNYAVGVDNRGLPKLNVEALAETLTVYKDTLLSPVYVGWAHGYMDEQRQDALKAFAEITQRHAEVSFEVDHPRVAFKKMAKAIEKQENAHWLE